MLALCAQVGLAHAAVPDTTPGPRRDRAHYSAWLGVRPVFMVGAGGSFAHTFDRGVMTRATIGPHGALLAQIGPLDFGAAAGLDIGATVEGTQLGAAVRGPYIATHLGINVVSFGWNCLSAGVTTSIGPTWFDRDRVSWRGGVGPYVAMRIGVMRIFVQGEFEVPASPVTVSAGFTWYIPILPGTLDRPR